MGKPYSMDLRARVVAYVEAGHSCRAAARVFRVSASTAVRLAAAGGMTQTAIAEAPGGDGIQVGEETLTPPYVIEAIGDPGTLATALDFFGGFISSVDEVGGRVVVEELDDVEIASVRQAPELRFAEPAEQG